MAALFEPDAVTNKWPADVVASGCKPGPAVCQSIGVVGAEHWSCPVVFDCSLAGAAAGAAAADDDDDIFVVAMYQPV